MSLAFTTMTVAERRTGGTVGTCALLLMTVILMLAVLGRLGPRRTRRGEGSRNVIELVVLSVRDAACGRVPIEQRDGVPKSQHVNRNNVAQVANHGNGKVGAASKDVPSNDNAKASRVDEAVLERAWIQGVRDLQDHKVGPHGLVEERKEPVNGLDLRMENIRVLRGRCCWAEGSWSCILTGSRCMCR